MAQNQQYGDMTFGLPEIWNDVLAWAQQHDVVNELSLIIDTCRLLDHETSGLGTVLQHLVSTRAISQLSIWADYHPACANVYRLAEACHKDPAPLETHKPLPSQVPVTKLFPGCLGKMYLLALLTRDTAQADPELSDWLEMLFLWILAQATIRAEQGNMLDGNLHDVCSRLSKAFTHDNKLDLEPIAWKIEPESPLDLSQINMRLAGQASWIASRHRNRSEVRFMNALKAVAQGEDKVLEPLVPRSKRLYHPASYPPHKSLTLQIASVNTDTLDRPEQQLLFGTDSETAYALIAIDETDSYVHQRLSSGTVWQTKAELIHFLPWSWEQLIPSEAQHLEKTVDQWLTTEDPTLRLLASLTWMALPTGRTLVRMLDIEIGDEPQAEWRLNPSTSKLHRLPPKRQSDWLPDEASKGWLRPVVEHQILVLPEAVSDTLVLLLKTHPYCQILGDLWRACSPDPVESAFSRLMTGQLTRVRSGMLANVLGRRVFDSTGNSHLARMMGFHPQAGLAGAFAYGNWDQQLVHRLLHPHLPETKHTGNAESIGIGSRFDPLDSLLIKSIQVAGRRLKKRYQTDSAAFHNAYTVYLVAALMAATGARPVKDPFESPRHFNHEIPCVYLNDKNDQGYHQGRLCPLPRQLSRIVKEQYSRHLKYLASALEAAGSELAVPVSALSEGNAGALPYFFLLDPTHLTWKSVSPATIQEQALFDWPLPANLFRQRIIKQLLRAEVDQEIINGWMGHADSGTASYGDYSIRCWHNDFKQTREAFEAIFEQLGFDAFSTWWKPPTLKINTPGALEQRLFGIEARTQERRRKLCATIRVARRDIMDTLGERDITELTDTELEQLTRMLIFHDNGMVRTNAYLRQKVYEKTLRIAWREKGQRRPSRQRLFRVAPESWILSSLASEAMSLYPRLVLRIRKILSDINVMQSGRQDCLILGAAMLALENRISNTTLLEDIANGQHFRLVSFRKRFYLEYSEDLDPQDPDAPVERHRIEPKTAHLLDRGLEGKRIVRLTGKALPRKLQPLWDLLGFDVSNKPSVIALLQRISKIMDQVNAVDYPGTVAAFLSGRVPSTSLRWRDWIRTETGKILELPKREDNDAPHSETESALPWEDLAVLRFRSSIKQTSNKEALLINADQFQKAIGQLTRRYQPKHKKQTLSELSKAIKSWDGQVSSALLLFAQWLQDLIKRGRWIGQGDYAANSPRRYFTALNTAFAELAYDADLLSMEEPEITQLYQEIIDHRQAKNNFYPAQRLVEFHHFAQRQGVESPDWDELGIPNRTRNVSPGLILENDYQSALSILLNHTTFDDDFCRRSRLLLLLCYRFGLRGLEALGLRRQDIGYEAGHYYLLVRNNPVRKLKRPSSRRIVPLLFCLSSIEIKILETQLSHIDATHGGHTGAYLFARGGGNTIEDDDLLKRVVNLVLKEATGNPMITLHHARHSFGNITSLPLYHQSLKGWRRLTGGVCDPERICQTTLGPIQDGRQRNTWASARLMGHGHPRTQMVSYQHFYGDWAAELTGSGKSTSRKQLRHVVNLDKMPKQNPTTPKPIQTNTLGYVRSDLVTCLKCLSLVSCGKSFTQAGRWLWMNPTHVQELESVVRLIGERMWLPKKGSHFIAGRDAPLEYLARIKPGGWQRLFEVILRIAKRPLERVDDKLSLEVAAESVGVTRQLTMRRELHFKIVAAMLDYFQIPSTHYDILQRRPYEEFREIARKYGFTEVQDMETHPSGEKMRVDPAYDPYTRQSHHVSEHCALEFKRNGDFYIRSSYELTALYIAYVAAIHFQA